ncbi:hypothetical protein BKA64DRAFT_221221 [Cadophora sp. MPI-SDFR-AT-0126]|nr:hypothetical protein BKA64DRAFT_221221 [Leotiomycetes sp. MPI-SDFR-AT-0126]
MCFPAMSPLSAETSSSQEADESGASMTNYTTDSMFTSISSSATSSPIKRRSTSVNGVYDEEKDAKRMRRSPSCTCHWENCAEYFGDLQSLRSHVRSHTRSISTCLWRGCSLVTKNMSTLNKHLDTHIKPHICTQCQHQAATARDLTRHSQSHGRQHGNNLFYCPFSACPWSIGGAKGPFGRRDNATRHMARKHPGVDAGPMTGIFQ